MRGEIFYYEQTKKVPFILSGTVYQLPGSQSCYQIENILQIPVSIAFGYFIDLTMYLFFWVNPQNYFIKVITLLLGCLVLGFGVYIEVVADVVMLIAGVLSFIFSGRLNGVHEGTVIAALLVGFIARLFGKKLEFIKPYLFPEEYRNETRTSDKSKAEENTTHKNVIVIGRQYGCGGHDIGKALAEKLGYEFYDQEIIKMIAGTTGMTSEFIRRREETIF